MYSMFWIFFWHDNFVELLIMGQFFLQKEQKFTRGVRGYYKNVINLIMKNIWLSTDIAF